MDTQAIITQRQQIVALLYGKRLQECSSQKLSMPQKDLTDAVGDCFFNLRFLAEGGYIEKQGFCYRLSAQGVLMHEQTMIGDTP